MRLVSVSVEGLVVLTSALLCCLAGPVDKRPAKDLLHSQCGDTGHSTIYDFEALSLDGSTNVSLSAYRGQVLLIVNVATY